MQKKDDKVGNKMLLKEGKEKKKGSDREKDRNKFAKRSPTFGLCACAKNKKAV